MNISAVVISKNEEKNIEVCLKGLRWCSEILVIDDYSTDKTAQIAKRLGAKVILRHLAGDFASQRNFGLEKAKGEWILFVDCDERISDKLSGEILTTLPSTTNTCFLFKRNDVLCGKELRYGEWGGSEVIRLVKKGTGRWKRIVHEYWEGVGETGKLKNSLLHHPHQSISEFIADIDFYSTLHAKQKLEEGQRATIFHIYFWQKFKFIKNWILKLGFLDGTEGFIYAMMMSFHSFLSWSKLWLMAR